MSETDNQETVPVLPPPTAQADPKPNAMPAPAPRRSGVLGWLLLLVVIAAAALLYWRLQTIEQGHDQSAQSEQAQALLLRDQVETLQRNVDAAKHEGDVLRARLDDAGKVNESLRSQVLGLSERARLSEDAIANLADKRLSGHDALLLNEAELLLVLGGERFALFSDPAPTLAAYKLADAALAEANDAAFSSVRQSIAAEIETLNGLQLANIPATQTQLMQLREKLAQLPLATDRSAAAAVAPSTSRWWQVFGQLVRVRRDADTQALLTHNDPLLARALLDTSLRDAQAALLVRDEKSFRAALATARAQVNVDFDTNAGDVVQTQNTLDELSKATIAAPAPQILGAALKELRNLRATHALRGESAAPKSAPAPLPAPIEGQS